jgi:hypothetical protein
MHLADPLSETWTVCVLKPTGRHVGPDIPWWDSSAFTPRRKRSMDCTEAGSGATADCVLWLTTGVHIYDVVDLVEDYAASVVSQA